jgi:SpoVK/Ycf46/Vps4 family AAA+-type ATPase
MASGIRNDWTDPSDGQAISTSIATKMLVPIVQNAGACPRKAHCALLLAGPPGTRKTSLVKVVAKTLGWALVSVPGSAILSEGWDRMEARATTVFRRVRLLTQCVLFFDEYEEFFRARGDDKEGEVTPIVGLDGRTIAAFITTGMLPRLQDLHDEGRCLIFLATNFPKRIDDAVRRTGRFDWIETIDHPQKDRAIAYATDSTTFTSKELLKRYAKKHVDSAAKGVRNAIEEIAKHAKPGTKVQFPFRKLEDALREGARASERGKSAKDAALPILKPEDKMDAPSLRD